MIEHPLAVGVALLAIEGAVLALAQHPRTRRLFSALPPVFWIYLLPGVAALLGVLPQKSATYGAIVAYALPASLMLLFVSVDLRALRSLGRQALAMMAASSLGIVAGGPAALALVGRWLPQGPWWSGFGALSASWLGGSANMVAVKASFGTPEEIFVMMVIVDVVVAYAWMALVLAAARFQRRYDRWVSAPAAGLTSLERVSDARQRPSVGVLARALPWVLLVGSCGALLGVLAGRLLPVWPGVITGYTWAVIVASTAGVLLSFTRARRLEARGATQLGYGALYLVLTAIGARADLTHVGTAPLLLLGGVVWVAIHALALLLASRLLRAPMFLVATASQANIGGLASAPIVAESYRPGMAQVGLLLAVIGNVAGTYLGLLCGMLCRLVAGG